MTQKFGQDTLKTARELTVKDKKYQYFSIQADSVLALGDVAKLPVTLKVLLENLLRYEDGVTVNLEDIKAIIEWTKTKTSQHEIAFRPARVLMQDFTGVPAVVDLAAMRSAMLAMGGDPSAIRPLSPVDLVIDHSVQVDSFGSNSSYQINTRTEMERNSERYEFLRWGQTAFDNFRVVPPGTGICHQVNLEYLAKTVWTETVGNAQYAYPDTLVGTDSHTTMINGLGVLGWGVGGIEAEAAMLGQPVSMLIPEVVGFELTGRLNEGITATDLVLTVTQMLRQHGVVGKFVEFFGPGLHDLALADRATIANMAPEYGATCGFFPVDKITLDYLRLTGRDEATIDLVEAYSKAQGMWHDEQSVAPEFTSLLTLDLSSVLPAIAGPKRPQDKVLLSDLNETMMNFIDAAGKSAEKDISFPVKDSEFELYHGDIVIAAITSCTNTSNPSVLMAAGLLAKNAIQKGLQTKPWVKTSLAPGSKVVTDYLAKAGLQRYLDHLGFQLVGYGCTTCIGNSGPLPEEISKAVTEHDIICSAILSGNRNFEGRIHPNVKANWLASPPLVVAYALAGTTRIDLANDPLGKDENGNSVFLKDIWPSNYDIARSVLKVTSDLFQNRYKDVFTGDEEWRNMITDNSPTYEWRSDSTYIQHPPFFQDLRPEPTPVTDIYNARILALLGDSITTDHISPAGAIKEDSPAGRYLRAHNVERNDFNSYVSRRGNHEVMMRGTFANIRIRNEMVAGKEGGYTKYLPKDETLAIYDAAMKYQNDGTSLVIIAGKEYGTGSSRDWAAKGTFLLGVRAVIAESFERIHRSNLIGMGVLPLQFKDGQTRQTLGFDGSETISIHGIKNDLHQGMDLRMDIKREDGRNESIDVLCRIDTQNEIEYYRNGGILQYVLRNMLTEQKAV